jgi:2-dehydro-3-deoxygalactonokinase
VAVDCGTSNVRAWGIAADGSTAFEVQAEKGMAHVARADFPAVLNELIAARVGSGSYDVIVCGMAGARQGWLEAPYLDTPARLDALHAGAVRPEGADARLRPAILPGVAQRTAGHEDVMRGEETQLLGLLHLRPGFEGIAILPGTHSKWAEIRDGVLVRFTTVMTGELYDVLGAHSVLRHALAGERLGPANEDGVAAGLDAGLARPDRVTAALFRTRSASLLADKGADWCSGYLSGLLVGAEIGAHRDWLGRAVVPLIGSARLTRLYGAALRRVGIESLAIPTAEATIAGLKAARAQ